MDHSEALRTKAAERYLLGELQGGAREEFEEHFFSCAECAEDVQAGAVLIENARMVFNAVPAPALAPAEAKNWLAGWLRPALAVPIFALLLIIVGYQNTVVIPHLKNAQSVELAPQPLRSFSFIASNSRGGGLMKISVAPNQPFGIFVDVPPQDHFDSYMCEFENESGAPELSIPLSSEDARNTVQLLIPAAKLRAGKHLLIIRGLQSSQGSNSKSVEVIRFPFTLESIQ